MENCGVEPSKKNDVIQKNKISVLKTIKVMKWVWTANLCAQACSTKYVMCQYYKWMAKRKMCYIMAFRYVRKNGMSTS